MLRVDFGLVFTAVNLIVLYILMKLFLFKPVHKILEKRQALVDQSLADADAAKASAKALEQQHSDSLQGIEEEKRQVLENARKQASDEYERIVADANARADGIIKNAQIEAQAQKDDIFQKAQNEIEEIIVAATSKVVGINAGSDGELYDQFLKKAGEEND